MVSDDIIIIEVVGGPPVQDESGPSAHTTKCGLCEKNKQPWVGLPRWMCNECMKAKAKCDKSLGQIGRRKDTKVVDTKGKAPGEWLASCASFISYTDHSLFHRCSDMNPATPTSCINIKDHAASTRTDCASHALFLGNLTSLPKIKTHQVDESEADSAPCKRLKTNNVDKECTTKIAKARLAIAMCKLRVLSAQAFLKDLEVWLSQMA